jgi:hypothetical protein
MYVSFGFDFFKIVQKMLASIFGTLVLKPEKNAEVKCVCTVQESQNI